MDCKNWIEIATVIVPVLTLLAVVIYTGICGYQAYIARDTARRQLRAYLGIGDPHFGEKFPKYVTISVKNGGQTPAYSVWIHLNRKWVPVGQGLPSDFNFQDLHSQEPEEKSVAYLNPGQDRVFTFPFDHTELDRQRNGEIEMYIYGHVDYVDIYNVSRTTKFFYQYKGINGENGAIGHRLLMQGKHNEAE